jgi:hypothetical protein
MISRTGGSRLPYVNSMETGGPTAGRYDTMFETAFTPWASLGGGVLIGLSAVL